MHKSRLNYVVMGGGGGEVGTKWKRYMESCYSKGPGLKSPSVSQFVLLCSQHLGDVV